jgi:hypothetical protein
MKNFSGSHVFIIYFKKESNTYYLRSYREKTINGVSLVMVKLGIDYFIKKKEIFYIGDIYFQLECFNDRMDITKLGSKVSPETKYI